MAVAMGLQVEQRQPSMDGGLGQAGVGGPGCGRGHLPTVIPSGPVAWTMAVWRRMGGGTTDGHGTTPSLDGWTLFPPGFPKPPKPSSQGRATCPLDLLIRNSGQSRTSWGVAVALPPSTWTATAVMPSRETGPSTISRNLPSGPIGYAVPTLRKKHWMVTDATPWWRISP